MGTKQTWHRLLLVLMDLIIVNGSYFMTMVFRLGHDIPEVNFDAYLNIAPWICIFSIFIFFLFDLYDGWIHLSLIRLFNKIISSVLLSTILTMSAIYLSHNLAMPRTVTVINPLIEVVLLGTARFILWTLYHKRMKKSVLVIGRDEKDAQEIASNFSNPLNGRYRLVEVYYNNIESIKSAINEHDVVVISSRLDNQRNIIKLCIQERKEILIVPDMVDILLNKAETRTVNDSMLFSLKRPEIPQAKRMMKRIFDLVLAFGILVISSPFMLIIMISIRLTSPGPAYFRQERLGRNGRPFELLKYRSMYHNAEENTGPILAEINDPRVTKLGAFLRASRLDELPQLINVLKGDMSLIGPRPEREFFVKQFMQTIPYYDYRMTVKPGITGLAQIMGKYNTSAEDKLRFDLMYIRDYSLLLDIKILLLTMKVVLQKEKALGVDLNINEALKVRNNL